MAETLRKTIQDRSEEEKALALSLRGKYSLRKVEEITGIPKSTIGDWEKELKEFQPLSENFAKYRIDILRAHQIKVSDNLSKSDLKKVSPDKQVTMLKNLWEMERVEAGKSTQNIGLAIHNAILEQRKQMREDEADV